MIWFAGFIEANIPPLLCFIIRELVIFMELSYANKPQVKNSGLPLTITLSMKRTALSQYIPGIGFVVSVVKKPKVIWVLINITVLLKIDIAVTTPLLSVIIPSMDDISKE